MSECGRCEARRQDQTLMCGLMVPDTHCPAATEPDDDTRALYCPSYQCKHDQCRANMRGLCWFDNPPQKPEPMPEHSSEGADKYGFDPTFKRSHNGLWLPRQRTKRPER